MRIKASKSKNSTSYSIIKDITIDGKRTTKIIQKIGNEKYIKEKAGNLSVEEWLNNYLENFIKNNSNNFFLIRKDENKKMSINNQHKFNLGYLFLQKIYYDLKLNKICDEITDKYQFKYDLNSILSNLIYSRIIYPSSKFKTLELCKNFLEQPNFEYQHILRALEVISKESDFIQSELYKNSLKYSKRNDKILFYDCTNYYFEIEEDDDFRKYGKSKEHRPNPIVGMGLFLDGDGIPLAFTTFPGNQNEQPTLKPLEKKIIKDFNKSEFVVCTDAGLASNANRKFNNINGRKFVTTQSLKKIKEYLKEWSLDLTKDWKLYGSDQKYDISKLKEDEKLIKKFYDKVFYKERWINENDIEQRLIITYSPKYEQYQKSIREKQIMRAKNIIENNPDKIKCNNENDPKRFIITIASTDNGEQAENNSYTLDEEKIKEESRYDGLYGVCTNLQDSVEDIIKINKRRWEIEESFRIMKSEFKARPVFLSRQDRIEAHFTTCFLALTIFRYLEKKLDEKYTAYKIIETLKSFDFLLHESEGYEPIYTSTILTNDLCEIFNYKLNYEFTNLKNMKKIVNITKS